MWPLELGDDEEHRGFRAAMRSIGHVALVMVGGLGGAIGHKVLG
jgi:hypothetical protein